MVSRQLKANNNMRYLQFTLDMPNCGSWNGRWSGENDLYARVQKFSERSKSAKSRIDKLLQDPYYYYRWDDGWGASVTVKEIDAKIARQIEKKTRGFCGYDWMISSILSKGFITAD